MPSEVFTQPTAIYAYVIFVLLLLMRRKRRRRLHAGDVLATLLDYGLESVQHEPWDGRWRLTFAVFDPEASAQRGSDVFWWYRHVSADESDLPPYIRDVIASMAVHELKAGARMVFATTPRRFRFTVSSNDGRYWCLHRYGPRPEPPAA